MKRIILILIAFFNIFNIECEGREQKFETTYREYLLEEKKRKSPPLKERKAYSPGEKEYEKVQKYLSKGKYEKAIEIYQKIMKKYPNEKRREYLKDKYLCLEIASCYEKLYQFSKARQIYFDLIKEYSDKDEKFVTFTVKPRLDFIDKHKLTEFEGKRKKKDISEAESLLKLVNAFLDECMELESFPLIEKAFKLNPNHPEILLRLGQVYDTKGDQLCHHGEGNIGRVYKSDALDIFYRIIREYPTSGFADDAQYYLAQSYCDPTFIEDNDYERAIREYEKLLTQYPDSEFCSKAQLEIGKCYWWLDNYHQAIEEYEKVIERYPGTEEAIRAQWYIGLTYKKLNNYEKAIEAFQKVIDNFPKSIHARLSLSNKAKIYEELKDYNKAIEVFEEYLRNYAEDEVAKEYCQREIMRLKKLKEEL